MEEEKIFKDLTKKYAELAKKIHSKDKRSLSLIKDCSKRIALLDKLRVLEVSYLKCLKNKVKRGQKGGELTEEQIKQQEEEAAKQQEAAANQQEAENIIGMELNKAKNTNDDGQDDSTPQNENHQRALDVCTTALKKSMDLKDDVKIYIENKIAEITNIYNNIDTEEAKAKLLQANNKLIELKEGLISHKSITSDDVRKYFHRAKDILAEKVSDFYNDNKETTLEEFVTNLSQKSDKLVTTISPVIKQSFGVAKQSFGVAKKGLEVVGNYGANAFKGLSSRLASSLGPTGGSKKTTYRLNGEKVVLLHKNKKVQRSIYVKGNGKTKYCKIDHQYILLSKLKNKIQ
jgi:hypothetical protein